MEIYFIGFQACIIQYLNLNTTIITFFPFGVLFFKFLNIVSISTKILYLPDLFWVPPNYVIPHPNLQWHQNAKSWILGVSEEEHLNSPPLSHQDSEQTEKLNRGLRQISYKISSYNLIDLCLENAASCETPANQTLELSRYTHPGPSSHGQRCSPKDVA